ncbi:hypothetical protein [Actinokineospora cianjurensis]|uniref:hypothetical protein n=1 Tax=Actinokineospora cianjurensis TaxID=585224 RepID=UPI001476E26E|nr:hypothetical protein [Actinokineospora cianjurensis]
MVPRTERAHAVRLSDTTEVVAKNNETGDHHRLRATAAQLTAVRRRGESPCPSNSPPTT